MCLRPQVAIVAAIFMLGAASNLSASCVLTSPEDEISLANLIFVGTLVEERSFWAQHSILTRYGFASVGYIKGQGTPDSLILYQDGGRVGNTVVSFAGRISFQVGVRYVVLAYSGHEGRSYPQDCGIGPFVIRPDSTGRSVVVDEVGATLVVFDGQHVVSVGSKPWQPGHEAIPPPQLPLQEVIRNMDAEYDKSLTQYPAEYLETARRRLRGVYLYPHQDPGDRVTEEQFLAALRQVVERVSSESRKK